MLDRIDHDAIKIHREVNIHGQLVVTNEWLDERHLCRRRKSRDGPDSAQRDNARNNALPNGHQ